MKSHLSDFGTYLTWFEICESLIPAYFRFLATALVGEHIIGQPLVLTRVQPESSPFNFPPIHSRKPHTDSVAPCSRPVLPCLSSPPPLLSLPSLPPSRKLLFSIPAISADFFVVVTASLTLLSAAMTPWLLHASLGLSGSTRLSVTHGGTRKCQKDCHWVYDFPDNQLFYVRHCGRAPVLLLCSSDFVNCKISMSKLQKKTYVSPTSR
jgi:hypothetical protein